MEMARPPARPPACRESCKTEQARILGPRHLVREARRIPFEDTCMWLPELNTKNTPLSPPMPHPESERDEW